MDFRNALVPNDNVNLYCSSITRAENAYAIVPAATVVVSFAATGGVEIYEFRLLASPAKLLNIALSADAGTFTLSKKGVYSVSCSINCSVQDSGSQAQMILLVNGVSKSFNAIFPAGAKLNSDLNVLAPVECDGITPQQVNIQVRYVAGPVPANIGEFRYGQISIIKVSD